MGLPKYKIMKTELEKLKLQYRNANTDEEKKRIDAEMQKLFEKDGDAFADGMIEIAKETADRAEELVLRDKLESVLPIVSVSYIAKNYFNKSRYWLYQRINGNIVNGKKAKFTPSEIVLLETAFKDISKKIGSVKFQ